MYILGISAFYHDSAACLLKDGVLIAAAQEERFTRIRHDSAFPRESIQYCLDFAGIGIGEVELVAYYEKPFLKFERILDTLIEGAPNTYSLAVKALPIWLTQKLWMRKTIQKELEIKIPVVFTGHHEAHAASCFFPSPFDEAAVLTVDGVGEWSTTSWGIGKGNRLEEKFEIQYPHSLGLLYSAVTQYLGFKVNSAEYKVMGLAPYGEPKYASLIKEKIIEIFPDGSYLLNMDYFSFHNMKSTISEKFDEVFGRKRRDPESKLEQFHTDMARSIQAVTEEVMFKLATHIHKETGMKNLCLAGGVALNCVSNGKILNNGPFKNIWIQPAAGDSGGAVGAAYLAWHHAQGAPRPASIGDRQFGSFLGPEYTDAQVERALKEMGLSYEHCADGKLFERTSQLLEEQNIVGWFQGRMEFGPRALGHRSILGDARNPEMQKRMNLKIKFRESFRPFAPSVLAEDVEQHFAIKAKSPYMLVTCPVAHGVYERKMAVGEDPRWMSNMLESIQSPIPAVTHVDGSARVHTVEKSVNPRFYDLLQAFKKRTGSSVVINTSFNVRGEPIVCTPEDAIRCFVRTNIDALGIGNFVVTRTAQNPQHLESLRKQIGSEETFELD